MWKQEFLVLFTGIRDGLDIFVVVGVRCVLIHTNHNLPLVEMRVKNI